VFNIKVIGNGNAFGEMQKFHTCFFCQTGETNFLMDCGATSIYNLMLQQVDFDSIDFIVISHFHGDHYGGLPFFILNACFKSRRERPLTIVGPPGCQAFVEKLVDACYPSILDDFEGFEIKYHEFGTPISINELTITGLPVIHSPESIPHGIRIEGEKTLAFSGDTEWTDNLIPLSKNADLFICECNNYNANFNGHLPYHILLEKINLIESRRIILTHMGADMYENKDNITLEMSEQDKVYEL